MGEWLLGGGNPLGYSGSKHRHVSLRLVLLCKARSSGSSCKAQSSGASCKAQSSGASAVGLVELELGRHLLR